MHKHAPTWYCRMTRALALSITTLLLPMAAVAADPAPAAARYSVQRIEAAFAPASATRYRVSRDASAANAVARYQLLGGVAAKTAGDACDSADGLFAHGFEN